jgi:hypothetical protein
MSHFLPPVCLRGVGHAGASAYIALMALFGVAPAAMRPKALPLGILVVSFTSFRYLHRICFAGGRCGAETVEAGLPESTNAASNRTY